MMSEDPCTSKQNDQGFSSIHLHENKNVDPISHVEGDTKKSPVETRTPQVFYVGHTVIAENYEEEVDADTFVIPCGKMGLLAVKMIFISICFIAVFNSLSMISNATGKAVIKEYSAYRISFRLNLTPIATLIALMITGILSVVTLMYISAAIWLKNHHGFIASVLLMVLLTVQAALAATSAKVTTREEYSAMDALKNSFMDAKSEKSHKDFWRGLESQFKCCGVKGPSDYYDYIMNITYVAPSCCHNYNYHSNMHSDKLNLEDFRQDCIKTKNYYDMGCGDYIIDAYVRVGQSLHDSTITLVVFEIIISFVGIASCRLKKHTFRQRAKGPHLIY